MADGPASGSSASVPETTVAAIEWRRSSLAIKEKNDEKTEFAVSDVSDRRSMGDGGTCRWRA